MPQRVRPQALITAALQVTQAGPDYVGRHGEQEQAVFVSPLTALVGYALRVGDLYERFLDNPDD